jgi:hypothetical protein
MTTTPPEPTPWWTSVTLEELALSERVVKDFIREGEAPSHEETGQFARALALQTLCVRVTALEDAIDAAAASTDVYRAWTAKGAAQADRKDPAGWANRSPEVRRGFELCLSMLPTALADGIDAKMRGFSERSKALEAANRDSYFLDGTRTPFPVARTRTLPKPTPRS